MANQKAGEKVIELLLPVQSGRTQSAVEALRALNGERSAAHADAIARCGIAQVSWYLAVLPNGTYVLAHLVGTDVRIGIARLLSGSDDFSDWLRGALSEIAGYALDARTVQTLLHNPLVLAPTERTAPAEPGLDGGWHGTQI